MSELYPWLVPTYHKISQTFSEGLGHHALLIKADQGLEKGKTLVLIRYGRLMKLSANTRNKTAIN